MSEFSDNPYMNDILREQAEATAYNNRQTAKRAARDSDAAKRLDRHHRKVAAWARHKVEIAQLKAQHAQELADIALS